MAKLKNFLLGKGEALMQPVRHNTGGGPKKHPYTFQESRDRLLPKIHLLNNSFKDLPPLATPENMVVTKFTLNPAYLAKSYFPDHFFSVIGQVVIGSKGVSIIPEKWPKKGKPKLSESLVLFASAKKEKVIAFQKKLDDINFQNEADLQELIKIEDIGTFYPGERIKGFDDNINDITNCEIVLHASSSHHDLFIFYALEQYADSLDIELNSGLKSNIGGITFIPAKIPKLAIPQLEKFTYLRCVRPSPKIRIFKGSYTSGFEFQLPNEEALNSSFSAAILDAGYDFNSGLEKWVSHLDLAESTTDRGAMHGTGVSSAFLFGSLEEEQVAPRPYVNVDNINVYEPSDDDECFNTIKDSPAKTNIVF